jgi:hypothetical protein
MSDAPKDGTPVRLHLRDGCDFIGLYSDHWWGWIALLDPWPLIRGDICFTGWEPVSDEEVRQLRERTRVPRAAAVATDPATGDREGAQAEAAALMSPVDHLSRSLQAYRDVGAGLQPVGILRMVMGGFFDESGEHDVAGMVKNDRGRLSGL